MSPTPIFNMIRIKTLSSVLSVTKNCQLLLIVQRIHSLDPKGVDLFISHKIQLFKANTRLQKQKQKVYPSQPYLSSLDFCPPCLRLISTIQNLDVGGRVNKFAQTSVPWKFIRLRQRKKPVSGKNTLLNEHYCVVTELTCRWPTKMYNTTKKSEKLLRLARTGHLCLLLPSFFGISVRLDSTPSRRNKQIELRFQ